MASDDDPAASDDGPAPSDDGPARHPDVHSEIPPVSQVPDSSSRKRSLVTEGEVETVYDAGRDAWVNRVRATGAPLGSYPTRAAAVRDARLFMYFVARFGPGRGPTSQRDVQG